MPQTHIQQRAIAITKIPQTNYATSTSRSSAADWVRVIATDRNLANISPTVEDNKGHATGFEDGTDQWTNAIDVRRQLEVQAGARGIGRLLLAALGAVTTTTETGMTDARQHLFAPMSVASSRQLYAYGMVEQMGSGLNRHLASMVCDSLNLSGQGVSRINCSASFVGSGKIDTPSGLTMPSADGTEVFFKNSQTVVKYDNGTVINLGTSKRLETWEFAIQNQLLADEGYRPGAGNFFTSGDPDSGCVRSECLLGQRNYSFNLTARFNSQDEELADLLAQNDVDVEIELVGPEVETGVNYSLKIKASKCKVSQVGLQDANGLVTVQIQLPVLFDVGTGKNVEVTLVNDVTSYTS